MVWGKVKHERKFSIYLFSLALHARISGRCPSYRGSIGAHHLLYDQVEIDRYASGSEKFLTMYQKSPPKVLY